MSALADAAIQVNKSWCKADLVAAAEAEESGDKHCAVGALMNSLLLKDGYYLDWTLPAVGTEADLAAVRQYRDRLLEDGISVDDLDDFLSEETAHMTIYNYINETDEAKVLAKVILDNYRDRIGYRMVDGSYNDVAQRLWDEENYAALIYSFNDNDDTEREEVIAMMEKADLEMESAKFDDSEIDELIEEVKELINA